MRSAPDGTGIMFLNEAALGKEHHITMDDHTLTAPPPGFDSVIAKGRTEPGRDFAAKSIQSSYYSNPPIIFSLYRSQIGH